LSFVANAIDAKDLPNITPAAHRRIYRKAKAQGVPARAAIVAAQYLDREDVGSATDAAKEFCAGTKVSRSSFWRQVRIGRLCLARLAHRKPVPTQWLMGHPMPMGLLGRIVEYASAKDFDPLYLVLHLESVEGISSETFEMSVAGFEPPPETADLVMPEGKAPSNWVLWSRKMSVLAAQGPAEAAIGKTFGQTFGKAPGTVLIEMEGEVMQAGTLAHRAMMPASGLALPSLLTFKNPEEANQSVPRPEGSNHGLLIRVICPAGVHASIILQETPDNPECWVRRAVAGDFGFMRAMQEYFTPLTASLSSYESAEAS
jgi:hypothetical protein